MYSPAELALWSESKIYWAIGAGLISHLGFSIQGEWDDEAPGLLIGYSLIFVSLLGANWVYNSQDACSNHIRHGHCIYDDCCFDYVHISSLIP